MVLIKYKDFHLDVPNNVYLPSDDTNLFIETLKKEIIINKDNLLEVGAGSGIISLSVYDFFKEITLVDIDEDVINYLNNLKKKNFLKKINIIKSDLFTNLDFKKYSVIIFNPPYVPSDQIEINSTDGGKKGSEVILKFLNNLKRFLNNEGVCYLLISSHNNFSKIKSIIKNNNFKYKIISEKKLFFEKLMILKISDI